MLNLDELENELSLESQIDSYILFASDHTSDVHTFCPTLDCIYFPSVNKYDILPFEPDLPQVLLDYFIFPSDEDATSINLGLHVVAGWIPSVWDYMQYKCTNLCFGKLLEHKSPSLNASVFAHSHSPTHVSLANTVEYPTRLIKNPSKLKQQVRQMGSSTPLVPKEPLTSIVNKIAAFLSLKRRLPGTCDS